MISTLGLKWSDLLELVVKLSVDIRIARAYSKKDNIAFCGYHGWHVWYLATNIKNKNNLNDHLLKGMNSLGVPKYLKGSIYPFEYNNFDQLKNLVKKNNIGIICMEVMRNSYPSNNFLQKIRRLANKNGIVLILMSAHQLSEKFWRFASPL